jgi:alkylation response protein AidB-like acyl-CoA dehydrogenase
MDFQLRPDELAFQEQVRAFIHESLPPDIRARQRHPLVMWSFVPHQRRWFSILNQRGWSVPNWPVEYGGPGWTPMQKFIFENELYASHAPEFNWMGSHMVGPTVYTFGSDYLKERFLPPIRTGEHIWAQGFSEPGAGSDLVSLRTQAVLEGETYIVSGQKIWTGGAYEADWGFFLVKTDPTVKPQRGISLLLIDLKSPGITIRRIPQINGEAHLCEVFLDSVRVPRNQLIGEANMGWGYAKHLLEHERTTSSFIFWNKRELDRAREIAASETLDGVPLSDVPEFRSRIARIDADIRALEWSVLRVLSEETAGPSPGIAASVLKLRGSELQQQIVSLHADMIGPKMLRYYDPEQGPPAPEPIWPSYVPGRASVALIARASTIYGGTAQVQRNILSKLAFGF